MPQLPPIRAPDHYVRREIAATHHLVLPLKVHDERRVQRGHREVPLDAVELQAQLHHAQLRAIVEDKSSTGKNRRTKL